MFSPHCNRYCDDAIFREQTPLLQYAPRSAHRGSIDQMRRHPHGSLIPHVLVKDSTSPFSKTKRREDSCRDRGPTGHDAPSGDILRYRNEVARLTMLSIILSSSCEAPDTRLAVAFIYHLAPLGGIGCLSCGSPVFRFGSEALITTKSLAQFDIFVLSFAHEDQAGKGLSLTSGSEDSH